MDGDTGAGAEGSHHPEVGSHKVFGGGAFWAASRVMPGPRTNLAERRLCCEIEHWLGKSEAARAVSSALSAGPGLKVTAGVAGGEESSGGSRCNAAKRNHDRVTMVGGLLSEGASRSRTRQVTRRKPP